MIEAQETKPPIKVGDKLKIVYVITSTQEDAYVDTVYFSFILCRLINKPAQSVWLDANDEGKTWSRAQ